MQLQVLFYCRAAEVKIYVEKNMGVDIYYYLLKSEVYVMEGGLDQYERVS